MSATSSKAKPRRRQKAPSIHKVNPAAIERAVLAATAGCTQECIAQQLGVTATTLRNWMQIANEPIEHPRDYKACRALATKLAKAEADGELALAKAAMTSALGGSLKKRYDANGVELEQPNAKVALRMLSSRCPERWAVRTHQQLDLGASSGVQVFLPALIGDESTDGRGSR